MLCSSSLSHEAQHNISIVTSLSIYCVCRYYTVKSVVPSLSNSCPFPSNGPDCQLFPPSHPAWSSSHCTLFKQTKSPGQRHAAVDQRGGGIKSVTGPFPLLAWNWTSQSQVLHTCLSLSAQLSLKVSCFLATCDTRSMFSFSFSGQGRIDLSFHLSFAELHRGLQLIPTDVVGEGSGYAQGLYRCPLTLTDQSETDSRYLCWTRSWRGFLLSHRSLKLIVPAFGSSSALQLNWSLLGHGFLVAEHQQRDWSSHSLCLISSVVDLNNGFGITACDGVGSNPTQLRLIQQITM